MKRILLGGLTAAGLLLGGLAFTNGGVASAHHPVLSQTTARACGPEAPWTGTVTAQSDQDWNKDWRSRHKVGSDLYSAWSEWVDDQVAYGPIPVGPFSASTASVIVTVRSEWRNKDGIGGDAAAERSITLNRPATTDCPPTEVTATATHTPPTCTAQGTVVLGQGPGYTWSQAGDEFAMTYTATASKGFVLIGQTVFGPWRLAQLTPEDEECYVPPVEVTPEYTYTPPTCDAPGSYTLGENEGYSWQDNEDGTFTAVANDGFVLADGDWTVGPFPTDQLTGEQCATTTTTTTTTPATTTTVPPEATTTTVAVVLPPTPPTTPPTTIVTGGGTQLPATGGSSWGIALIALVAIGMGLWATSLSRRRA